jgi:hypothetical protein
VKKIFCLIIVLILPLEEAFSRGAPKPKRKKKVSSRPPVIVSRPLSIPTTEEEGGSFFAAETAIIPNGMIESLQ